MRSMVIIRHYDRRNTSRIEERRFFDDPMKAIRFVSQFNARVSQQTDKNGGVPETYLLAEQPMRIR